MDLDSTQKISRSVLISSAQDGRTLSYIRRRRGKNALANADGTTLDEATVASFLGGISKEMFEKVFALDHHRLHEHAKALLSEGGSLGFSLAEAGSGIAGLKAVLDRLKKRAHHAIPSKRIEAKAQSTHCKTY